MDAIYINNIPLDCIHSGERIRLWSQVNILWIDSWTIYWDARQIVQEEKTNPPRVYFAPQSTNKNPQSDQIICCRHLKCWIVCPRFPEMEGFVSQRWIFYRPASLCRETWATVGVISSSFWQRFAGWAASCFHAGTAHSTAILPGNSLSHTTSQTHQKKHAFLFMKLLFGFFFCKT